MSETERNSMNLGLTAAREAKKDEFYTQYVDIQKEVEAYLEFDPNTFLDKVVYCNYDDPFESNFLKYFATNFNRLGPANSSQPVMMGPRLLALELRSTSTLQEIADGRSLRPFA